MPVTTKLPARVRCQLRDSGNAPITNGWLQVTADSTIAGIYDMPKVLITKKPRRVVPDQDGLIDFEMVNSEDSGVTYLFELGYTESVVVAPVPPATSPTVISRDTVTDKFHAMIPRPVVSASGPVPIDLSDLLPTGISLGSLDASILRVAEVIVGSDSLRRRAVQQFSLRGPHQATASYQYGDVVSINTPSFQTHVCTSPSPTNPAALPLNPNLWMRLT